MQKVPQSRSYDPLCADRAEAIERSPQKETRTGISLLPFELLTVTIGIGWGHMDRMDDFPDSGVDSSRFFFLHQVLLNRFKGRGFCGSFLLCELFRLSFSVWTTATPSGRLVSWSLVLLSRVFGIW